MYQLAVFSALYAAYKTYKWMYPTRWSHIARKDIRRLMAIESDEDFLRAALTPQAQMATSYARKVGGCSKGFRDSHQGGFVYVARMKIHPDRVPGRRHLRGTERLLDDFVQRLHDTSHTSLFKVGYTRRSTGIRIAELNSSERKICGSVYWPYNFEFVWSEYVENCFSIEKEAHRILRNSRIANEIFYATEHDVINAVIEAQNRINGPDEIAKADDTNQINLASNGLR